MASRTTWLKRTLIGAAAAFLLMLLWSVWALFGPLGNGIPIGPETTYLDGPLDAAGYVDYAAVLREDGRVPPEENAAVAVFRVLQADLRRQLPSHAYAVACEDLGVDTIPDVALLVPSYANAPIPAEEWNAADADPRPEAANRRLREAHLERMDELRTEPWRSDDHPEIAEWVADHRAGVDLLQDGLQRPGWWFFPPQESTLIEYLIPMTQEIRRIARFLSLRAMNHIGDGHFAAAADDVDLIRTLAARTAKGVTLIDLLVAVAVDGVAYEAEQQLLRATEDPAFVRSRLAAIDRADADIFRKEAAARYGRMERFFSLEQMQLIDRFRRDLAGTPAPLGGLPTGHPVLQRIGFRLMDPAEGSRMINEAMDAAADSLKQPVAAEARDWKLDPPDDPTPLSFLDGEYLTDAAVAQMLPAVEHVAVAVHRARTRKELLRVLAAGRLFQLSTGRPPGSPDDLVPDYLPEWPTDHEDGKPLRHETQDGVWTVYGLDPTVDGAPEHLRIVFPPE